MTKLFDRKFGADFLKSVPPLPGVYRFLDASGQVVYVGKAKNLRRRLGQYRNARRKKRDRKHRDIVGFAARIEWEVTASDLDACLHEIRLIQALRPPKNVAGAYSFLYPYIGILPEPADTYFCFTTLPEAYPSFRLHGAYRSRFTTGGAFFALMSLLRFVGHPIPRERSDRLGRAKHSYLFGFRRLPAGWAEAWERFFRGESRAALEDLSLALLDKAAARAKSAEVQEGLRALDRFWDEEARELALAIAATGFESYPVPQAQRDPLFLRARCALKYRNGGP